MTDTDVVIVGAGLAGLCCARVLHQENVPFLLLEASDGIGGRVRTDIVDGFVLDRGFQVLQRAYPEAQAVLDYDKLELHHYYTGAFVRYRKRFHRVADPFRDPISAAISVFNPIGTLKDKFLVLALRKQILEASMEEIFSRTEKTTEDYLKEMGFSPAMIERFFRPFFSGIFLEPDLQTSSRMMEFVFRMFTLDAASVPKRGMQEIPKQIADSLPEECIRLNTPAFRLDGTDVCLADGERIQANTVVVATQEPSANALLNQPACEPGQSVSCVYFEAPRPAIMDPVIVLNGDGSGPINNMSFPTLVCPAHAPEGKTLVSVSTVAYQPDDDIRLQRAVSDQLESWFGKSAQEWRHIKTYRIPYALPRQSTSTPGSQPTKFGKGLYRCGDYCETASINGAMVSGRKTAESIIRDRKQ